ncbi:MAG: flagellar motor switch phosphatase FliY [Clostridium sp.]|uniref:Flagellar motor switch phosphatase FliY n=2 Tax=Clostridium paraputrificum TaxID=29363 RepID=A0A1B8RTQ0_9CLOT|nr:MULTISPECIES: flagellar motor switch phosphatase FliY [Clostridium]MDU1584181.1 flagellar motor switch phosphatase FliY [Clostridium sp.]MDU1977044.1 flagellar motor switch phosphatase FliY [Clostridium sp.]MDU1992611.1 flagellar motor switch phosphatase FliY [Clostridium sp.]MDU6047023.1 flagellar motor switch phosphatase FliY [Clostridium sp.]MDU6220679.1 flagellar motor switch phosphatase FliY [Clostridium sp.]
MSNGFLSQEEIDSLLNGSDDSSSNTGSNDNSVNLLSDIEKDLLGEIGNISMGSASTALYQIINQKVNITTPVVSITTLKEIKETFETPTVVLDVEYTSGIIGRNILIIKTEDAAVIANLMMGGDGIVENHELSEIEISAVQEAMNQMIGSAATSMATMFSREVNISPPISKIWSNSEDALSSEIPEDQAIVRVNFRMTIGNLVDSNIMQILPVETAKKIVSIMIGKEDEDSNVSEQNDNPVNNEILVESYNDSYENVYEVNQPVSEKTIIETPQPQVEVHKASFEPLVESKKSGVSNKNIDLILDVPLDISVVLGRTKKSIKDILNFSTGSLIELDKLAEEPVEVLVNGKTIALGEVVVVDENFGVRITSIVSNTERINSLKK